MKITKKMLLLFTCWALFCSMGLAQNNPDQSSPSTNNTKATRAERDAENQADEQSSKDDKASERAEAAAKVLNEISNTPDRGIPNEILRDAKCVLVIPGMKKAGFIFGARYGRGFATCRTPTGWSAPAPVFLG